MNKNKSHDQENQEAIPDLLKVERSDFKAARQLGVLVGEVSI